MKKFLKVLLVMSCLSVLGACSSTEEAEEVKTEYAVNETATIDDVSYTVTSVEKSQGEEYFEPDEGKEYVIVSVKIENNSEEKIDYNELYFTVVNSEGQEDDVTYATVNEGTELGSGSLVSGGSKEGTIVFEETIDDELTLNLYSDIFSDEPQLTFKLS